jgi:chromosome segregation ATPase
VPHHTSSKSAEQWKTQIEAQKKTIEMLQRQMDRLSATIHYVEANRYVNGAQHNLRQEQKEAEVGRMQDQMEMQKQKLNEMQEAARKDGFGNGVYDP